MTKKKPRALYPSLLPPTRVETKFETLNDTVKHSSKASSLQSFLLTMNFNLKQHAPIHRGVTAGSVYRVAASERRG